LLIVSANVPEAKKLDKELTFGQEDTFFVSRLLTMNERQFFMNGRTTEYKVAPPAVTLKFSAAKYVPHCLMSFL
jgi:hypothetical protein